MAYQAKRSKKVIEEFELVDENDKVVECLKVDLSAPGLTEKIRQKYVALVNVQQEVQGINAGDNTQEEVMKACTLLGTAVVDLIEAVFGREDAEKIVAFYENGYSEMVAEVLPFISDVVLPRMNEIRKENKKAVLSKYNRRQRRALAKKGF